MKDIFNGLFLIGILMSFGLVHCEANDTKPDDNTTTTNEESDLKSKENVQLTIDEILSEYHYENRTEISLAEFEKVFQRFMTKDLEKDNSTNGTSFEDDIFLKDLTGKIIEGLPQMINVKDIYSYIAPERIEKIFNELLGDMDLTNFFDKEQGKDKEKEEAKPKEEAKSKPTPIKEHTEHTDL